VIHENTQSDAVKAMPHVCKALYDLDSIFEDDEFVKYYEGAEKKTPGYKAVREKIQPFVDWLKDDDSDDDSDSD